MKWLSDYADLLLFLACLVALGILFAVMGSSAHAAGCLSIDVPAQAVLGNHDGDTFTVFSIHPGGAIKFRVEGVNTPEMNKKKGEPPEPGAVEAREFTRKWLAKGWFKLTTCGKPTLDRLVASVSRDGRTLAQDLQAAGLAKTP